MVWTCDEEVERNGCINAWSIELKAEDWLDGPMTGRN